MNSLVEFNGVFFSKHTPALVQEVVLECIKNGAKVHILTGDPLTGLIVPKINSVGVIVLSNGDKPVPMLRMTEGLNEEGKFVTFVTPRDTWLSTEKILKISDVTQNQLLYQSYDCQCSPLRFVCETKVSPYGNISKSTKIVCSNPECEFIVPDDADALEWCNFLFGKTHKLSSRK